jgi:chemotaxis protein MotA
LIGFAVAIGVFLVALFMSSDNIFVYANAHAFVIVFGGTLASTLVSFPVKRVWALFRVFVRRMLGKNRRNYARIIEDIVLLAQAKRLGAAAFVEARGRVGDPFLQDAASVLEWGEAEIDEDQLRDLLETRADTFYQRYMKEAAIFRSIAKFPPAFGLLGTTLGMIALLQSLGEGSQTKIGPAMGIALVATLYGIVTANMVLLPIAENLTEQTEEDRIARSIVVEGVMMIHTGLPTKFIEEKAKSFLLPGERGDAIKAA